MRFSPAHGVQGSRRSTSRSGAIRQGLTTTCLRQQSRASGISSNNGWSGEKRSVCGNSILSSLIINKSRSLTITLSPQDTDFLRHKDIFKHYVMPQMTGVRTDWDNLNDGNEKEANSLDECRAACEKDPTCKQYSYDRDGKCTTRVNPRLGIPSNDTTSGWMEDRVASFERDMAPCENEGFDSLPGGV